MLPNLYTSTLIQHQRKEEHLKGEQENSILKIPPNNTQKPNVMLLCYIAPAPVYLKG